jgi:hypothetical protein
MKIKLMATAMEITREEGDPKFHKSNWCLDPLSTLLHHIKKILNKSGCDLIKKRMWKDGHMYGDDILSYLRTRSNKSPGPHIYIYDGAYAVRCAAEDFNAGKTVTLLIHLDVFNDQPNCVKRIAEVGIRLRKLQRENKTNEHCLQDV